MPRPGACAPWINGRDVAQMPRVRQAIARNQNPSQPQLATAFPILSDDEVTEICAEAASMASDVLFDLSARQFTGECGPVTIRPVARPVNVDSRPFLADGGAWGFGAAWGSVSWFGYGNGGVVSHFGNSSLPELPLGAYPVRKIISVKIDGVEIPGPYNPATQEGEWELRDYKVLVRIRPTASSVPTERWGWPVSQIQDLPDTQQGTFSVTYTYGQDPGSGGRRAARVLAEFLALPEFGVTVATPQRTTQIQRQGETVSITSPVDMLRFGKTGLYPVDLWLNQVNPKGQRRQSQVWSPDIAKVRRVARPSV